MGWDCYKGEFSHWMPLPEPPNDGAEARPPVQPQTEKGEYGK